MLKTDVEHKKKETYASNKKNGYKRDFYEISMDRMNKLMSKKKI